jgi:hypothetical protein
MRNEPGRVFAVHDRDDDKPFALVRQNPDTPRPELWTRLEGWVDCPLMLSYFHDEPGPRIIDEDGVGEIGLWLPRLSAITATAD